jgi:DUF971 family protein
VVALKLAPDAKSLELAWDDGQTTRVASRRLRQACPCAACVDEWTNKRTLDVEGVPEDLQLVEITPVGNYALALKFGDGHATGIFPWPLLRELS